MITKEEFEEYIEAYVKGLEKEETDEIRKTFWRDPEEWIRWQKVSERWD